MPDIPAPKADTVSVYLNTSGGVVADWYDRPNLRVTDITILPAGAGALVWIDPLGHIQLGEDVLSDLIRGVAGRAPHLRSVDGSLS